MFIQDFNLNATVKLEFPDITILYMSIGSYACAVFEGPNVANRKIDFIVLLFNTGQWDMPDTNPYSKKYVVIW